MYSLTDAFENGGSATAMTIFMGVVASLLFTTGLFLIFASHSNSQSKNLQRTISALQKNLAQSGQSSSAALLSLEAALAAQEGTKMPTTIPNSFNLDSLTVKGSTTLQGTVKTGKDLNVSGGLTTKGDTSVGGDLNVSGNVQAAGDVTLDGDLSASALTLSDSLTVGSDSQTADTTLNGDLTVTGAASADSLTLNSDAAVGGGLTVSSDSSIGGQLDVTGAAQLDGGVTVTGDATTDTLTTNSDANIGGSLTVTGATQLNGGVTTDTVTTTDTATIGGDLQANSTTSLGAIDSQNQLLGGGDLKVYGDTTLGGAVSYSLGSNLITTPDFTNIAWTGVGWTTTSTTAAHNTGNTSALSTGQVTPTIGQTYQVDYTVTGSPASGSTLLATFGGQTVLNSTFPGGTEGNSSVSLIVTASSTAGLSFAPSSTFDGTISAVSIKHVNAINPTGGTLDVVGATTLEGGVTVTGDTTTDTLTTNGDGTIGHTLTIDNSGAAADGLTVSGNGSFDSVSTNGNADIGGTLTIDNSGAAADGLTVSGNGSFDSVSTGGDITAGGNAAVGGALTVAGAINAWNSNNTTEKGGQKIDNCNGHVDITQIYNGIIVGVNGSVSNGGVTGCSTGTDLAEYYPSTQSLSPGDVVSIDTSNSQYVVRSTVADDNLAIGIVSTNPGETLGDRTTGYPIALSGRVPVNVTNEGGSIAPGDYLTSSSTPGYAMRAAAGDKIIGQALAGFDGTTGQVQMFINISPGNSTMVQTTQAPTSDNANFTSLNVSGPSNLSNLTVTGAATINNLTVTGISSVATLIINGHVTGNGDTRGVVTIPAGQTTIHHDFTTAYTQTPVVVASPEGQPASFSTAPTATGFDINLASPAASDLKFDYLVEQ